MNPFLSLNKLRITPIWLILLISAFLVVSANYSFFDQLTDVYPLNSRNLGFLISLAVFLFAAIALLTLTFSVFFSSRVVTSLLILLSAATAYYADNLGVVIDTGMIRNIVETDTGEVMDLLNSSFILRMLLSGMLPVILIWSLPFEKSGARRMLRNNLQTATGLLILMVLCILPLSDHYASFFREHKTIRYYSNPTFPVYSIGKYIHQKIKSSAIPRFIALANRAEKAQGDTHTELIILVVGETARSDHFSLNGYNRITNPRLSLENRLISYSNISACGTSTAVSVPCMFAFAGHDDFIPDEAEQTENILDILKRASVNILWRDNNSSSKGVASRVTYEDYKPPILNNDCDIECRDTGMLTGLQEYVDSHPGDILIVLHQMGSHGPAYFKRYPREFEHFKPACHTAELSECTSEEIINAYDNTILYTDYFLSKTIEFLKKNTPKYETAMFYVSDHGESLGESGIYLHGLPYLFAPEAQVKVPVIAWIGETSDIDYEKTLKLTSLPNSHDALFGTLLQIFEIRSELDQPDKQTLVYIKDHYAD